jgi:putative FmdB family regulatory protein
MMPRYEYKCVKCEDTIIVSRSIHDDDPGYTCEKCNEPMQQVMGNISLSFKGTGWSGKSN